MIRYQRDRFRGGDIADPGSPRYELGLQLKEDVLHRLVDVWATGEASASLGFAAARLFDELDPLEKQKDANPRRAGHQRRHAPRCKALRKVQKDAIEFLELAQPRPSATSRTSARGDRWSSTPCSTRVANVLCPACKLWNTGHGANMMREAVSLMGGYGITEDCPGFLGHKWMDAQLEATYEGPEAVQRRQLSRHHDRTSCSWPSSAQWIREMRADRRRPARHRRLHAGHRHAAVAVDARITCRRPRTPTARKLYQSTRQGVTFPLADALCWLLASRCQILDVLELESEGPENPAVAEGLAGLARLPHRPLPRADRRAPPAKWAASAPNWSSATTATRRGTSEGCRACYQRRRTGAHRRHDPRHRQRARAATPTSSRPTARMPAKAGPCVRFDGLEQFARLRVQAGRLPDRARNWPRTARPRRSPRS